MDLCSVGYYGEALHCLLYHFLQHVSLQLLLTSGAIGTPLWFGFAPLQLSDEDLIAISYRSSIAMMISSLLLLPWVLTILIPFAEVKKNLIFLYLSIFSVMEPLVGLSFFSYEFPSLLAGLVGCMVTAILINFRLSMAEHAPEVDDVDAVEAFQLGGGDAEKGCMGDVAIEEE